MSALVCAPQNGFAPVTLQNRTTGLCTSIGLPKRADMTNDGMSAEWIVEGISPDLPDFGAIVFLECLGLAASHRLELERGTRRRSSPVRKTLRRQRWHDRARGLHRQSSSTGKESDRSHSARRRYSASFVVVPRSDRAWTTLAVAHDPHRSAKRAAAGQRPGWRPRHDPELRRKALGSSDVPLAAHAQTAGDSG